MSTPVTFQQNDSCGVNDSVSTYKNLDLLYQELNRMKDTQKTLESRLVFVLQLPSPPETIEDNSPNSETSPINNTIIDIIENIKSMHKHLISIIERLDI